MTQNRLNKLAIALPLVFLIAATDVSFAQKYLSQQKSVDVRPLVYQQKEFVSSAQPMAAARNSSGYWNDATKQQELDLDVALKLKTPQELEEEPNPYLDEEEPIRMKMNQKPIASWPGKSIRDIKIDFDALGGEAPEDRAAELINQYGRSWGEITHINKSLTWCAPNIRYQPLYFEDVALERYGNVVRGDYFQTAISAAHFFSSAALLPLHMWHDRPYACDYPLGYCRPGNCNPVIFQRQFWGRRR